MIRDFQVQAAKEYSMIKSLGIDDIIYKPFCLYEDRSPYIYIFYNSKNEIIYIGQTQSISNRMIKHIEESDFWNEVFYIMYAETPTLKSLTQYERYYIQKYTPKYNKIGFKLTPNLSSKMPTLVFNEYKGKEVLNYVRKEKLY